MSIESEARLVASDAVYALKFASRVNLAMKDAMTGQPGGQRYGDMRGTGTTVTWCWEHQRDVKVCRDDKNKLFCTGETMTVKDPAGEAALVPDTARDDQREAIKQLQAAGRALRRVRDIYRTYEDTVVVNDRAGIGECMDCKRYADGKTLRLSVYKGTGDPVCPSCRARRDRTAVA